MVAACDRLGGGKWLQANNSTYMIALPIASRRQLARTGLLSYIGAGNVFPATPRLGEALNTAVAVANVWLDLADTNQSRQSIKPHR